MIVPGNPVLTRRDPQPLLTVEKKIANRTCRKAISFFVKSEIAVVDPSDADVIKTDPQITIRIICKGCRGGKRNAERRQIIRDDLIDFSVPAMQRFFCVLADRAEPNIPTNVLKNTKNIVLVKTILLRKMLFQSKPT